MSFPRYPEYKDSGVEWLGAVPGHWQVKRIRHVAQLNPSKTEIKQLDPEMLVSFLPMESVGDAGSLNLERETTIAEAQSGYTYFREGDVTYAKITPCFENGKGAHMRGLLNGIGFGSTELVAVRPDYNQTTSEYLNWIFRSPVFRRLAEANMYGAGGQKRVPDDFTRDFALGFPKIEEQVLISRFLSIETAKLDNLMAEQEKLIALLKEKRQVAIAHAVTKGLDPTVPMKDSGVEWLGEVPAHWTTCALSYRYEIALGKMLDEKRVTGEHLAPYLRNVDVQWGHINIESLPEMDFKGDDLSRYSLRTGDLLVCEGGEVGRAAIWRGALQECYYQKALHRLRPRSTKDSTEFLYYVFHTAANLGLFAGSEGRSTIAHLTAETLRRYRFAFPPQPEQTSIANRLNKIASSFERLIQEAETAISLLKERRTALISAAVTGQIDVRGLVKEEQEQAA